jgi:hypothetical protein
MSVLVEPCFCLGFVGLEASILANLYAMQNPVPDAPPGQSVRLPEGQDAADAPRAPAAGAAPAPATIRDPAIGTPTHAAVATAPRPVEIDGPSGPEPTRYGDWERKGRCIDF